MPKLSKVAHYSKRLLTQKVSEAKILPGMLLTFEYGEPDVTDRRPLILVLGVIGDRIEGVNFNYLKESQISQFYEEAQKLGVEPLYENYIKLPNDYIRVPMATKYTPSRWDGQTVYKRIFKKYKIFRSAYRSYKMKNMTATKVVNYKIEGLE
tara:strand:- start:962 stop:1417 length:456 start_codon:yes stop_codon:yes gene_type:complete